MKNTIDYNNEYPDKNIYETDCPILYALDIVGQKWKLPIMWYLFKNESTRYNELKRSVKGITNMMLTKSLKELEERGLVIRKQYDIIPPRVEYSLTERGKALLPTLDALYDWGEEQIKFDKVKK
ncbi:MAG: helix-turn-helix domain-containing protein [Clostridium perfringens]|nr:helix-turn-helix domain-containing protein [Clostridium perfringens]